MSFFNDGVVKNNKKKDVFMKYLLSLVLMLCAISLQAEEAHIAVAAAFQQVMPELIMQFEKRTPHKITFEADNVANLFDKIKQGAKIDVFLSADAEHPILLEQQGFAVVNSRFSYAIGRLVLWSMNDNKLDNYGNILRTDSFKSLAMPDPKKSPYGLAAMDVLKKMGLDNALKDKLVFYPTNLLAKTAVEDGKVDLAFLALSVLEPQKKIIGSIWLVPNRLQQGIEHQAVLLKQGENNIAAQAFLKFLKEPFAQNAYERHGYSLPQ